MMKRKALLVLTCILTSLNIFAVTEGSTRGSITAGLIDSATFNYRVVLSDANVHRIGFSSSPVVDFSAVDESKILTMPERLRVEEGQFTGQLEAESVYVYWQIQSNTECSVSLTAGPMTSGDSVLNIQISTIPYSSSSDKLNVDNGIPLVGYMTDGLGSETGGEIFTFSPSSANKQQAVGSQEVVITTENFQGRPADTYMGTMTLTITGLD